MKTTITTQHSTLNTQNSTPVATAKPMLINEKTYKTLHGDDREDYIRAVKNYNKTGDKIYRTAALYFENGKQNPNGINIPLLKKVQRLYNQLDKHMYQKEIARRSGASLTHLQHIISGSHTGLNDTILHQTHKKLKALLSAISDLQESGGPGRVACHNQKVRRQKAKVKNPKTLTPSASSASPR